MRAACAAFREVAPELALGIAVGDERAAALDHLSGCDDCRRELARLAEAVDAVVLTAPAAEPPSGFEVRALATFEPAAPAAPVPLRRRPVPRRVALAVAAVLLVVTAVVGARAVTSSDGGSGSELATGSRTSAVLASPEGTPRGAVRVERAEAPGGGWTSQLVVSVDAGTPAGTYRVECDYETGRPYRAGELTVGPDGLDEWRATVSVPTYDLRRVRLISADDDANLEAEFPS
ncbi:MAG TPA: hypothetical protein VNS19_13285 [Acidimicrobiales bacterium]|nr:hypothetical protein [Acidimicrobiales bacterium]